MGALLDDEKLIEHLGQPLLLNDTHLRGFDQEAGAVILGLQLVGWRGIVSSKGHAIMRAPDGETTCSVSRASLRGRSGRNAASALKAWLREHPLPLDQETTKRRQDRGAGVKTSGAFGRAVREQAFTERVLNGHGKPLPVVTQAEIKRHPMSLAWLLPAGDDPAIRVFITFDEDDGHRWAYGDEAGGAYEVKAFGTGFATADDAHAFVLDESPHRARQYQDYLYRDYLAHQGPIEPEDDMQVFKCPECDKTFETRPALGLHLNGSHGGGPCPECGKVLKSKSGIAAHRYQAHDYHAKGYKPKAGQGGETGPCQICGKHLTRGTGFASHMRGHARHGETAENFVRPVSPVITPDTPRVRLRSSPTKPEVEPVVQPGADVLANHLLNVPEGADAEDLIARVRAIVAAPLVEEVRRLRTERDELRAQVDLLVKEKGESEAKMSILREALTL